MKTVKKIKHISDNNYKFGTNKNDIYLQTERSL